MVSSYQFSDTTFFNLFAEMVKRVWLLHYLGFAFEVYMESVAEEAFLSSDITLESEPKVAFTVVPGFRIGKTVIQCQVYLSQLKNKVTC